MPLAILDGPTIKEGESLSDGIDCSVRRDRTDYGPARIHRSKSDVPGLEQRRAL